MENEDEKHTSGNLLHGPAFFKRDRDYREIRQYVLPLDLSMLPLRHPLVGLYSR